MVEKMKSDSKIANNYNLLKELLIDYLEKEENKQLTFLGRFAQSGFREALINPHKCSIMQISIIW